MLKGGVRRSQDVRFEERVLYADKREWLETDKNGGWTDLDSHWVDWLPSGDSARCLSTEGQNTGGHPRGETTVA